VGGAAVGILVGVALGVAAAVAGGVTSAGGAVVPQATSAIAAKRAKTVSNIQVNRVCLFIITSRLLIRVASSNLFTCPSCRKAVKRASMGDQSSVNRWSEIRCDALSEVRRT
jgi:hypothetical protein